MTTKKQRTAGPESNYAGGVHVQPPPTPSTPGFNTQEFIESANKALKDNNIYYQVRQNALQQSQMDQLEVEIVELEVKLQLLIREKQQGDIHEKDPRIEETGRLLQAKKHILAKLRLETAQRQSVIERLQS